MTLTSRYFGALDPREMQCGRVSAQVENGADGAIPIELAVADSAGFGQGDVDRTDAALDFLEQLDQRIRTAMIPFLLDESSVPGRAYGLHKDFLSHRALTPEEYSQSLRIAHVVISPDGGGQQPDRVSITYTASAKFIEQRFRAIAREGAGFVFRDGEDARRPRDEGMRVN